MFLPRKIVLLVFLAGLAAKVNSSERHLENVKRSEKLDDEGKVNLSWEVKGDEITFELWAETTGFVGFGISPQGGMKGADIFIAGVYPNGTAYSSDRYGVGQAMPQVDDHSDWNLLEASETDTITYLKFSRLLETCDDQDYPITTGTNRLIWAFGENDEISYHKESRGPRSTNLLDAPIPEVDLRGTTVWNATLKMEMPHEDTAYWCSFHKGPVLNKKHHVLAFDALLPDASALKHTHHFILYNCYLPSNGSMDETFENITVDKGVVGDFCYKMDQQLPIEYCREYLYVWAKGGKKMVFPEDIGYPIGQAEDAGGQRYYMLEIHYDNPDTLTNVTFEAGMQMFYTDQLRTHDAGLLMIGHDTTIALTVPPNTAEFVNVGHCGSFCTDKHVPQEGIKVFNALLHSHISGRKLKLRHFRNSVELPWIDYDDHYDFDYQQNKPLVEEVEIFPGDHLSYECTYDSTWANGSIVVGGLTTREEMCETFLWYYPKLDSLDLCGSSYTYLYGLEDFGVTNFTFMYNPVGEVDHYINEPEYLRGDYKDSLSHKFNWTEDFKKQLENKRRYNPHDSICTSRRNPIVSEGTVQYPPNIVAYAPEDKCKTNSGSTTTVSGMVLSLLFTKIFW